MAYSLKSPILIASPTRCGTTMLGGLLIKHGVWVGEARVTKAVHTNSLIGTENTEIKKYLRSLHLDTVCDSFARDIGAIVDTDGRWFVKTAQNLLKWKHWYRHFPQAWWLFPTRPTADIVASAMRHPGMAYKGAEAVRVRARHMKHLQNQISEAVSKSLFVDVNKVANKDEEELERMFEFLEIPIDLHVCLDFIDPSMWRRAARGE